MTESPKPSRLHSFRITNSLDKEVGLWLEPLGDCIPLLQGMVVEVEVELEQDQRFNGLESIIISNERIILNCWPKAVYRVGLDGQMRTKVWSDVSGSIESI